MEKDTNKDPGEKPLHRLSKIKTFGDRDSKDWENMLIFGDNLTALGILLETLKGRVRLVYIDPPFSTNQVYRGTSTISRSETDALAYEDTLSGGEYLESLRKRLVLLRELLADDGTIYLHIDWKMGHYVKVLMDEIFGQERFINDIARVKCNPKNFNRRGYGNIKDMVLFYSKTGEYVWNDPREVLREEDIALQFPKVDERGRRYTTTPLHAPGETRNGPTGEPWRGMDPPKGRHWRYPPESLEKLDGSGLLEWSSTGNPRKKSFADDIIEKGRKRQDIWEFKDPTYRNYPTEKNLDMLRMVIEASSNPGDIVLDCYAGSGTTLVAAGETDRKWLGIDDSPLAVEVAEKRLKMLKRRSAIGIYKITER